ncbi:MAG: hypothetical protein IPP51_12895 [Bacteroidetes bacterium]|nr:hypothetical protein [Bacteroidota bacterium]
MSLIELIQLFLRNRKWTIFFPVTVAIVVFALTRNTPRTYSSETVIYTGIASGFNPDNAFDNKLDFHAANSRFDNLINIISSKETRKEVAVQLLAFMLHHDTARTHLLLSAKNKKLSAILTNDFVLEHRKQSEKATIDSLLISLEAGSENEIYKLIFGNISTPFNVSTLAGLHAVRLNSSDMLKIEYTSEDALTCKKTLDLATDIFLKKYQGVRIGEADVALKYFMDQTNMAKAKLALSEETLKRFRSNNGVINYYEQTKYVADQKDDIEKNATKLKMDLQGYRTALAKLEEKLGNRTLLQLQNEKIISTRNQLASEFEKKGLATVKTGMAIDDNHSISDLKGELKKNVESLYTINNTTEGLQGKDLLNEWLNLTLSEDETQSKLTVLLSYQKEFEKVFDRFAPLGSDLSKLERDVDVSEKEYLSLLHSLSQAVLRKNNLQASENISIVDSADLPMNPNPSKRFLLVIVSLLSCSIIAIVILILKRFMDHSISNPLQLEKLTGIGTATAFTKRNLLPEALREMDIRSLSRWDNILDEAGNRCEPGSVTYLIPFNCSHEMIKSEIDQIVTRTTNSKFSWSITGQEIASNISEEGFNLAITDKKYPEQFGAKLLSRSCTVIFIMDAAKKIDEYEMQIIEKWKASRISLKAVLVNVNEIEIAKYLGEIPKKRSKFRAYLKRQIIRYAA